MFGEKVGNRILTQFTIKAFEGPLYRFLSRKIGKR